MKYLGQVESNEKPKHVVIQPLNIDVHLNIVAFSKKDEQGNTISGYKYDLYRFDRNELEETDEHSIKVNALIRTRYSESQEFSILRKKLDGYASEFNTYNTFVNHCKEIAED